MIKFIKQLFKDVEYDKYVEGKYAHEYEDPAIREEIYIQYQKSYVLNPMPDTHPELYNPLDPPDGWAYDPFYEIWITTDES